MGTPQITVCVLLHGGEEHAWLHKRCLESLRAVLPSSRCVFHFGLNAMTAASTQAELREFTQGCAQVREYAGDNIGKYPRMREMLADVTTDHVMWFDDDSYLDKAFFAAENISGGDWLALLCRRLEHRPGILGHQYYIRNTDKYWAWARQQSWYTPRSDNHFPRVRFITGGWWVATTELLRQINWPPADLHHNGGDTLLGHILDSLGFALHNTHEGVAINANELGQNGTARRRGINERRYRT